MSKERCKKHPWEEKPCPECELDGIDIKKTNKEKLREERKNKKRIRNQYYSDDEYSDEGEWR